MSIILVHGLWGYSGHWGHTILELKKAGYAKSVFAVENPLTSLQDDANRVKEAIETTEEPVLLVGHSYGGEVITEAGTHPKVKGLVYIAAFGPDAGEPAGALAPEAKPHVDKDKNDYLWLNRDHYHELFCEDLPADEAFVLAATQKAPRASLIENKVTKPAWKEKPSWYQISTKDHMIEPSAQRETAKRMKPKKTIELECSHASLASRPKEVSALIVEAAKDIGVAPR